MKTRNIPLFVLSLFALSGYAQESDLLKDYRSQALQYNQDVQASEKNIRLSRELEKSAQADYKPKLAAGANFNYTGNPMELSIGIPSLDRSFSFQGRDTQYGASLSLTQPLYTGGRIRETVRMSKKESSLAINQSVTVKSNICYEADLRYWNTVACAEIADITGEFRQSVGQLTNVVRERVEVELVDRNDLLMAEVKLNDADYRWMQAKNNYEVACMSLNSFIGVDLNDPATVDSLIPAIHVMGADEKQAVSNRAELLMAQDRISIQQSALKLNDSKYRPQLYVGVDGSYGSPGYNFKSDLDPNYAVYAKLSIPLFEWGKRKNEKQASAYRVDIAKDNYGKVSDQVNLEIQSAYYSYNQAIERVRLTESSLGKARENENLALERYKEGKISIAEVLDAQIYHQTAQLNYVQSRLNAQLSRSEYIRALGIYPF